MLLPQLMLARRGMTRYSITRCGKVRRRWELTVSHTMYLTGVAEPAHLRTVRTVEKLPVTLHVYEDAMIRAILYGRID